MVLRSFLRLGAIRLVWQALIHPGRLAAALALTAAGLVAPAAQAEITIATDFEGASAKILKIDQEKKIVRIMPAGDPKEGWPCWWYLRVDGLAVGDKLRLELVPSDAKLVRDDPKLAKPLPGYWAIPLRATFSTDAKTWRHTVPGRLERGYAVYDVPVEAETTWLAWGPPFTPQDAAALVKEVAERNSSAKSFELTKSLGGRTCFGLRLKEGELAEGERRAVWIQARQHAWETGSSWVCGGVARWLASDDPRAQSVRETSEIYLVPIMDIDRTATGNGGKDSLPHDHNRGWTDKPHYPEVAAVQAHLKRLSEDGRLALFIDLHNPSPFDKQPFFFVAPESELKDVGRRNLDHFLTACGAEMTGPLKLAQKPRVSGPMYARRWKSMSKNWVVDHAPPHAVAVTLEVPWDTRHSTTEGYQTIGTQLGLAIERYLRDDPRK